MPGATATRATGASALCDPRAARVAAAARFAHVAVRTPSGPHVTPVLFALTADRIWLAVPRATLKARMLAAEPRVGLVLGAGDEALAITGEAAVLDPQRPAGLPARWTELARAPLALPAYALRNAIELAGFAADLRAPGASSPHNLVLVAVRPDRVTLAVRPAPVKRSGRSAPGRRAPIPAAAAPPGVPARLWALAAKAGPTVLGWETADGPLALPATWDPSRGAALLAPEAVAAAGLAKPGGTRSAPACVCFDLTDGPRPSAKAGLLLRGRGRGRARAGAGGASTVALDVDRATYWSGFQTATVSAR